MRKTIISVLLLCAMLFSLVACKTESDKTNGGTETMDKDTIFVEIEMEDGGKIKLALYRNIAPITVDNFVKLASEGFYDGLTFHRIYKGFMIQGGDPNGNGTGNSGTKIKGEFAANGVNNTLSHKRGVISMARGNAYDSASCQFFICDADSTSLDGQYAAFGEVIDGMDVVDEIANTPVTYNSRGEKSVPLVDVVIKTIRVVEG